MNIYGDEQTGVSEHTGFPNAATDSSLTSLDLAKLLIKNPASTYFMRISGNEWAEQGIFAGDIAIVDRALQAHPTDLVVWVHEAELAISTLPRVKEGSEVWGVVTHTIHGYRP